MHTYIRIYLYICVYVYTYIYTHTDTYIHAYTHTHMHNHRYTYTYTCTCIYIYILYVHTHTHQSQTQHIVRWLGWFCWPHWLTRMATGPGSRHRASSAWDLGGSLKADAVWQGPSADFERVLSACRCWTGQALIVVQSWDTFCSRCVGFGLGIKLLLNTLPDPSLISYPPPHAAFVPRCMRRGTLPAKRR